jgi:hypothetical protein
MKQKIVGDNMEMVFGALLSAHLPIIEKYFIGIPSKPPFLIPKNIFKYENVEPVLIGYTDNNQFIKVAFYFRDKRGRRICRKQTAYSMESLKDEEFWKGFFKNKDN